MQGSGKRGERYHEDDSDQQAGAVFPGCHRRSAGMRSAEGQGERTSAVDEAGAAGAVAEVDEDLLERGPAGEKELGVHLEERLYGARRSPCAHARRDGREGATRIGFVVCERLEPARAGMELRGGREAGGTTHL